MKLFVNGRKHVFQILKENITDNDRVIWMHAASLGEYEQGVPILEALKAKFPDHKILVTFFSPSGYEVKKNSNLTDVITYLPLDTKSNAEKFIEYAKPDLTLFIKYEVWPNYLKILNQHNIPTLLISGNFRKDQIFFKSQAGFMKNALHKFDHLFVQNKASKDLLEVNGFKNVTISGDTRFDRVSQQLELDNHLDFVEEFKNDKLCIVAGSTWPEDEDILLDYINKSSDAVKFIIAPHEIKKNKIENFQTQLHKSSVLYSEKEGKELRDYNVLIIDTVGLLTKTYAYADIAFVGGASGNTGLHNILEPAAFGIPVIIGKNHHKFPEARMLQQKEGLFSVNNPAECSTILHKLVSQEIYRLEIGENAKNFIEDNRGATLKVMSYINKTLEHEISN